MFSLEKKYLATSFVVTVLLCFTIYSNSKVKLFKKTEYRTSTQRSEDDISCHEKTKGDALPSAEDASFLPPADSIFFHETSCRGELTSRQACAVESAAKAHPRIKIYVLFSGPISAHTLNSTGNSFFALKQYSNIEFVRVHALQYSRGTALHNMFINNKMRNSRWKVSHTSDILRIITMLKFGGIYLDTDVVVLKPLHALGANWVARQSSKLVNTAVMSVGRDELGQGIMKRVLEEIDATYQPSYWSYNGPDALTRVLTVFCNTTVTKLSNVTCQGFHVFNPDVLYPVPYERNTVLFEPGIIFTEQAYTVHLWNHLSQHLDVQFNSPVEIMASRFCPVTYELYEDSFGFY